MNPTRQRLRYRSVVAPPKRKLTAGADTVLAEIVAAHADMRVAEAHRAEAARRRADAVNRGIEAGWTFKELAIHLGVTRQRVQQMRTVR